MIVVTGAAGFIGSCLIAALNERALGPIVAVDDFGRLDKNRNLLGKKMGEMVDRRDFHDWLKDHTDKVSFVFHMGARTDTTETDEEIFDRLNLEYSKKLWEICSNAHIPLIYASSGATYGLGDKGFSDDHEKIPELEPLNPYGWSKQKFDLWALRNDDSPPDWYGFKFFNVYGPNEYHKGRMASVVLHAYRQVSETGKMKLFRSHRDDIEDGYQSRDFIYIKDVTDVLLWFYERRPANGIYNLGTGKARPFIHLARAVFIALEKQAQIEFIDTPADIRDNYQYFTQAEMEKLRSAGYEKNFTPLEYGVLDYVRQFLLEHKYR